MNSCRPRVRSGQQLVELNRQLADAQQGMLRAQSMARLGEMAAGAAHEMNNPLAVISGRAQLLAMKLPGESPEKRAADQIARQAEKLSDLITSLRLFAEPPRPDLAEASAAVVLEEAIRISKQRDPAIGAVMVSGVEDAPPLHTDAGHVAAALAEVLLNAHEAKPRTAVRVRATVDPINRRLLIQVTDDGAGMDAQTLEHAFDPFFSAKPAGRQAGLGLARARRFMDGVGGDIQLTSHPGEGTVAKLMIPLATATSQPKLRIAN